MRKRGVARAILWTSGWCSIVCLSLMAAYVAAGGFRAMLWRTVQVCTLDHRLVGLAFPCLAVQDGDGGVIVLRGPLDASHIVVTPTARISGIEDPELRDTDVHSYLEAAWRARGFAQPAPIKLAPSQSASLIALSDLGLAINSRLRRTQDQLHVHVDCVRPSVKRRLATDAAQILPGRWTPIALGDTNQPYLATRLSGGALDDKAVVELAAAGVQVGAADMSRMSIAIVATGDRPDMPDFVLLAQLSREDVDDVGHAEELLDHDCRFRSATR